MAAAALGKRTGWCITTSLALLYGRGDPAFLLPRHFLPPLAVALPHLNL